MENRVYAVSLTLGIIGILFSLLFISPSRASAATFWPGFPFANNSGNGQTNNTNAQLVHRLCDRQNILGNRLGRLLIDPSLCDQTPPAEPTLTFTADPSDIDEGESSTLAWSTTNATSCTASVGWSGAKSTSGEEAVSPDETTTYTLSCSGPGGSVSESVTVTVDDTPLPTPSLSFTANPTNLVQGSASMSTSTLTWDSTNADTCNASNGWGGSKPVDGSEVVQPTGTTSITYVLTCTGAGGPVTQSVTLTVGTTTPTVNLSADPTNVTPVVGLATSTLTWTSSNATFCLASGGWSGERGPSGTQVVEPSATTTYTLDCSNSIGTSTDSVTVNFVPTPSTPSPTLTFNANPTHVTPGPGSATSTLTWASSNASACEASGGWSGSKGLSGTEVVQPVATTTYTLLCGNGTASTSESVTVNFVPSVAPSVNQLLISEVYYDVASTTAGSESNNEWIEVYNGTGSAIDLQGWSTGTLTASSSVIANSAVIQPGAYAVIAASTTPAGIPGGVTVVVLNSAINGGGLANTGDAVFLRNAANAIVDAVSWGSNTDAFNPSVSLVADGSSIIRSSVASDANAASDWTGDTTPSPGQAN